MIQQKWKTRTDGRIHLFRSFVAIRNEERTWAANMVTGEPELQVN
jgi:hypothetical protein